MKVCSLCGDEISTRDGENRCAACEKAIADADFAKARKRKEQRKDRDDVLRSLGLKKVRGAMGGTYWE